MHCSLHDGSYPCGCVRQRVFLMAGGAAPRNRGSDIEREIAAKLTDLGVPTRRVIGSGAHGHIDKRLKGDLQIGTFEGTDAGWLLTGEVKKRKDSEGFKVLEGWLGDNDLLLLRRNHREAYTFMPWDTLVPLLQAYYREQKLGMALNTRLRGLSDGDNICSCGNVSCPKHLHGGEK